MQGRPPGCGFEHCSCAPTLQSLPPSSVVTPMRRSRATMPRLAPRRRAPCAAHGHSHVERPACIITVAAVHKAQRRLTSPDAPRLRSPHVLENVNRPRSSTANRKVSATNTPVPRMDINRRHTGSQMAHAPPVPPVLPQACPRPKHRFCRSFKHKIARSQLPDAKFKPATALAPTLCPMVRSSPRRYIAKAIIPCRTALQAQSTARTPCAKTDLQ